VKRELKHHALVTANELGAGRLLSGGTTLDERRFAGPYFTPPESPCVFHQLLGNES
jgi:hypothetical protein